MNQKQINRLIKLLKINGVVFEKGLNDDEMDTVEQEFEIKMPPDLKVFLQTELPTSGSFVNWRFGINSVGEKEKIIERLNWPKEGMLFDIEHNSFWLKEWGTKPKSLFEQKEIAIKAFLKQPKLIPIYSHRYLPSTPNEIGNPIFSVYQMDIIYYGNDLADYLANEFGFDLPKSFGKIGSPKQIDFWSKMIELNF